MGRAIRARQDGNCATKDFKKDQPKRKRSHVHYMLCFGANSHSRSDVPPPPEDQTTRETEIRLILTSLITIVKKRADRI